MGIKISVARAYQEQERARGKIWDEIRESNTEWALGGLDLPEEPSLGSPFEDLSLKDW
jgi:hypothetical protein